VGSESKSALFQPSISWEAGGMRERQQRWGGFWLALGSLGALAFLVGLLMGNDLLMQFARIFPHLALVAWWWENRGNLSDSRIAEERFRLLIGLVACTAADFVIRKPQGFIAGVFGFLLGQIAFVSAFWSRDSRWAFSSALPFFGYAGVLVGYLWPNLGPMQIPVAVYAVAIAAMGWRSWVTCVSTYRIGAILFMVSDSLLALEKFAGSEDGGSVWLRFPVILTYWAALTLLMKRS